MIIIFLNSIVYTSLSHFFLESTWSSNQCHHSPRSRTVISPSILQCKRSVVSKFKRGRHCDRFLQNTRHSASRRCRSGCTESSCFWFQLIWSTLRIDRNRSWIVHSRANGNSSKSDRNISWKTRNYWLVLSTKHEKTLKMGYSPKFLDILPLNGDPIWSRTYITVLS